MLRTEHLLPNPSLSALLLVLWLLLANTIDAGQILLGVLFAGVVPWLLRRFQPSRPRRWRPWLMCRLAGVVLWDIVCANLTVARLLLRSPAQLRPQFVALPLDLTSPTAITLLAGIITLTPGTVSVDLSPQRDVLWIHALDCADAAALIADIKQRYEAPLRLLLPC